MNEPDAIYTISSKPDDAGQYVITWQHGNAGTTAYAVERVHGYFREGAWVPVKPVEESGLVFPKVEHYKAAGDGDEDFIDNCYKRYTPEEFRGAMKFYIGKYYDRLGEKDDIIQELTKAADIALRFLQKEKDRIEELRT
jgi:hypothetical protein